MRPSITVEMLPGGQPLLRFPFAFVTQGDNSLEGQINLSIENIEEAKTLRDGLSAFIEFHERMAADRLAVEEVDEDKGGD